MAKKADQDEAAMQATQRRMSESNSFFPFVSGEILEEHRRALNQQMRSEI
jgi:hypothetical protein